MNWKNISFAAAALFAVTAPPFMAQAQQEAHVHGLATLMVAVDGKRLHVELESPAANIVGFEYHPGTKEEMERVHEAAELLEDVQTVFNIPSQARCVPISTKVESALLKEDHDAHDEAEKDDDHDDHDKAEKDDDHDHDSEHEGEDMHSEFHVTYRLFCDRVEELTYLDVNLFKLFPATEALDARFATGSGQGAAKLYPGAARLAF